MEARDDGPRVRPIPLDDGPEPVDPSEHDAARPSSQRPWIPLTLALVGIAVAVTTVSVFGALRFDDPEPPASDEFAATDTDEEGSTTTATTVPPRLDELLPGTTDRLTLMAERDGDLYALLWDPTFREPKAMALDIDETSASSFTAARFDRSGRMVAVERCGNLRCDLFAGTPTDLGTTADVSNVISFTWHASEVGRIAWVTASRDGYDVVAGELNPLSGTIEDRQVLFTMPDLARLVQWDGLGFVLQATVGDMMTSAVDPQGSTLWERPGMATTATDRIVAVATAIPVSSDSTAAADAMAWGIVDRLTGDLLPGADPAGSSIVFVAASESADLVGQISARDTGPYSLRVSGGDLSAQRIVTIQQRYTPTGFIGDGTYFLLIGGDRGLVFVNWNRGTSHEVTAPDGYRILGVDLG